MGGCKQTDACLALWRRNQRFTLPFMNFGDMSLDHSDGKPIYVDDECTAYANMKDSSQTVNDGRAGLSYAKFSYDTNTNDQANGQMSQWESSCRWCCAARSDAACNIYAPNSNVNETPFATQCGTSSFTTASVTRTNADFSSTTCELSNTTFGSGVYAGDARFFRLFMLADPKGPSGNFGSVSLFIDDFVKMPCSIWVDLTLVIQSLVKDVTPLVWTSTDTAETPTLVSVATSQTMSSSINLTCHHKRTVTSLTPVSKIKHAQLKLNTLQQTL